MSAVTEGAAAAARLTEVLDPAVVVEVTQAVWGSFVDAEVELLERWDAPTELQAPVVGSVDIAGPVASVVHVALSGAAARELASRMLDLAAEDVVVEDVLDAVGEVTNMVGGNLKAVLVDDHRLGLPVVTLPRGLPLPGPAAVVVTLQWGEHEVLVSIRPTRRDLHHLPLPTEPKDTLR